MPPKSEAGFMRAGETFGDVSVVVKTTVSGVVAVDTLPSLFATCARTATTPRCGGSLDDDERAP